MPAQKLITLSLVATALCAGFVSVSQAQGGWRQWDVRLRDGTRLEANPLGAPDDGHFSLTVGAFDRRDARIPRSRVQAVVALPFAGESLPAVPTTALCEDTIVLRDGTTTTGRITLVRVRWSEGVITQRGDTINLRDVAYLVFAPRSSAGANCRREAPQREPEFTFPCVPYAVGSRQMHRLCADDRWM